MLKEKRTPSGNTSTLANEIAADQKSAAEARVRKYAETKKDANELEAAIKSIKPIVEADVEAAGGAMQVTIFEGSDREKLVSVQFEERNDQRCGKDMPDVQALKSFPPKLIAQVMTVDPKKAKGLLDAKVITPEQFESLLHPCTTSEALYVREVKKGA